MKCRNIQDMIITDYLDNQVTQEGKALIESHLEQCQTCREFFEMAREMVVAPFEYSESQVPPESIWKRIKESLNEEQEELAPSPLSDFLERVKEVLFMPKAVPVMAAIAILLLVTVALPKMLMYRQQQLARASQEEIEYLAYLSGETEGNNGDGNGGYDTDIEAYFL